MSQKENQPENQQDQVNSEVENEKEVQNEEITTEQQQSEIGQASADEVEASTLDEQKDTVTGLEVNHSSNEAAAPAPAKATGWKVATGVLAAAVIGLAVYAFVPGSSSDSLAKVNSASISQNDVFDKIVKFNYDYVAEIVEASIDEQVLEQELKAKNITITEEDLSAELAAFRLRYPDDSDFQDLLAYYGMSEDDLKDNLKQSTQIRLLLADNIEITDEKVSEYFETNKATLGAHGERVRASHILVADEAVAKDIIAQLDQGADFATLAGQYGTDGTAQNGGDLGFFEREGMIPVFSDAAFGMELNTYTKEPVQSEYGYHVILKTDEQDAYEPTLDALKDAIKVELANTEIYTTHPTYIDDLRAKASINNTFSTTYPAPAAATTEVPVQ